MKHQFTSAQHVSHTRGDPIQAFEHWRALRAEAAGLLLVDFSIDAPWQGQQEQLHLTVIYCMSRGGAIHFSVVDAALECTIRDPEAQYAHWLRLHGAARVEVGGALRLGPVSIPKPWGREIWFTGVEERGVCCISDIHGQTPLPWVRAAMPERDIGCPDRALILLKILDPVASAERGDLYFELHEEKQEVYVVTHVDEQAWPGGVGYIRYGFSTEQLALYEDTDDFRYAYRDAVLAYERVRRALDGAEKGSLLSREGQSIDSLESLEVELRDAMYSFTHLRPIEVGDVIKVPLLTPHSLQHGVRTVEFQTPVYERKILSFTQEVLTQDHWDTSDAVEQMLIHTPEDPPLTVLRDDGEALIERVVDFDDFEVRRVQLYNSLTLEDSVGRDYAILMVISGVLELEGEVYKAEEALILPRGWIGTVVAKRAEGTSSFLLAIPRHAIVES